MSGKNVTLFAFLLSILFLRSETTLFGEEKDPPPLLSIGGGYLDSGVHHRGGVFQLEYRWGKYLWHHLRPQIILIVPEFRSLYIGLGISWDLQLTDKITITPSFSPGLYLKGKGRDLGFPLEFRSTIEFSYKLSRNSSIGVQAYHISNAHLGKKRNPGMNAFVVCFAVALE